MCVTSYFTVCQFIKRILISILLHMDNIRTLSDFFLLFIYSRFRNLGKNASF